MGNGYTRQSETEITDGEIVYAAPINAELDAIQAAFNGTTGASHDGTAGEGPKISLTNAVQGVLPKANGGTGVDTDVLVIASGSANAIAVTSNEAFVSLTSGKVVEFEAIASNTGNATLNANGLGSRKFMKYVPDLGLVELDSQDIIVGNIYRATYDQTLDSGNGVWILMNPSGVLRRITPVAQTDLTISQLTGDESTLKFNSLLGTNRAKMYWNSIDSKLYIKLFNSSGVQVGNPIVFDGSAITIDTWSSNKSIGEAVLNYLVSQTDATVLGTFPQTTSNWTTWPGLSEAYDPKGFISVASNQFTSTQNGLMNWTASASVSASADGGGLGSIKTRLYDVTSGTVVAYSTILYNQVSLGSSDSPLEIATSGGMIGHGVVVSGHTYRIEYSLRSTSDVTGSVYLIDPNSRPSWYGDFPSLVINLRTTDAI